MQPAFKKYMNSYRVPWKILTVIMAALTVVFIVSAIAGNDVKWVGLPVFVGIMLLSMIPLWRSSRFFKSLEEQGIAAAVEADFAKAQPMRKGRILFGNNWIYKKGTARVITYSEIVQVYQFVQKTNFIESERMLKYVDTKGKTRTLCDLELRGRSDEELKQIIGMIYIKNPGIKVGYK